jgi:hypothetical protein
LSIRSIHVASVLVALAFALGAAPAASASALSTPLVAAGDGQLICIATNVGTKAAEVSVEAVDISGNARTFELNFCSGTLAPRASCYARLEVGDDAACIFTYRGTVKAALQVFDPAAGVVSAIVPAAR